MATSVWDGTYTERHGDDNVNDAKNHGSQLLLFAFCTLAARWSPTSGVRPRNVHVSSYNTL